MTDTGLAGMVGHRAGRRMPPHGRADAAVVAAMRQAIGEAADEPTRTAAFVFRRTRQILAGKGGAAAGELPSERTLYRLFGRLEAGRAHDRVGEDPPVAGRPSRGAVRAGGGGRAR